MNLKLAVLLAAFAKPSPVETKSTSPVETTSNATLVPVDVQIFKDYVRSIENDSSFDGRVLENNCNAGETLFQFDLTTDDSSQTRWVLKQTREVILRGPQPGTSYNSNTHYANSACLSPGTYKLVVIDDASDGFSDGGKYLVLIDGKKRFRSPKDKQWKRRVHNFEVSNDVSEPPTPKPSSKPTAGGVISTNNNAACSSGERKVQVEIYTDKFGDDTSWEIINQHGNTLIKSDKVYGPREIDTRTFCLKKNSAYDFVLRDKVGDGMREGYYKVYLLENDSFTWREIISGGSFRSKELRYTINLNEAQMTDRDIKWLEGHNSRRKEWHTSHDRSYVPLQWSEALKDDAKVWAEKLLDSCGQGMYHDPDNYHYGENVAGNSGSGGWGDLRSPDAILTRFVENEAEKPWPKNSHLTQVLWRSTKYVGCAEASKPYGNNGMCHTQVCRYSRSGNCNMNKWKNANSNDWWLQPMLLDETQCGFACPPDGCS